MLSAGTGRSDITPAPGTPQGGWGAQTHERGITADLPLYATALTISDGACQFILIDVDAIGFDEVVTSRILDEVQIATGMPRSHIRLSCTHTHSGPNTFRLEMIRGGRSMIEAYIQSLPAHIAGAAWQSMQSLTPVRVQAASGICSINVNRRVRLPDGRIGVGVNSGGFVDHTVRVVSFAGRDGEPVANLLHYACHPTTIAWQSQCFTPDYPGMARHVMERATGARCLFLQGAAGNLGPKVGFTGDHSVYRRWGRALGLTGAALAANMDVACVRYQMDRVQESGAPIALYVPVAEIEEDSHLDVAYRMVPLPVRVMAPPEEAEAEAGLLRDEAKSIRERGASDEEIRFALALATQAGIRAGLSSRFHGKATIGWPLQTVAFGGIALSATAGEPFAETGVEIAKRSPFPHTLFSGYSNGGFGYLPTREAFAEGGYEVSTSPFTQDAADVLRDAVLEQLQELKR